MNIEIFKRNIQLSKLGIAELDNFEKKAYDFLVDKLTGLCTYTSDKKPGILYFGKNTDNIVLIYDSQKECLHVDDYKIWSFFERGLSIDYTDTQSLMEWWVGLDLDLKPKYINSFCYSK